MNIHVFENNHQLQDLSAKYRFGHNDPQQVSFTLDASNRTFDVVFIPDGKSETFAEIDITRF
jgi:hypothetical protein